MIKDKDLFSELVEKVREVDPVYWTEKYLYLDGRPFRISTNGWKPYVEMYRYIGLSCLSNNSKPVVFVKSRQIAGTTTALFIELFLLASGQFGTKTKSPIRIVHCFPQLEMAARFSKTKFNSAIATSLPVPAPKNPNKKISYLETKLDKTANSNDSLSFKQFAGGSHIFIESTGLTADRIRGITCDAMLFDEVQDMRRTAIDNAKKSLTQAQYGPKGNGIQFYFGTPKKKGSDYNKMWLASSQQYYHLGCEKCEKDFPLYTPGSDKWEKIWIEDNLTKDDKNHGFIVKCVHCGHEQNKIKATERGKWVAYNKDPDCLYVGFHLNQLFIPTFSRSRLLSEKPEKNPLNTERAYQNEVLGEFFSGNSAPITTEEIDAKCGNNELSLKRQILQSEQKQVFIGFDWGQKVDSESTSEDSKDSKVGKSFCCAVVLELDKNHLNIVYTEKFKKTTPEYKIQRVDELFRLFNPTQAAGDLGYANDLSYTLHEKYGDKFVAMSGLGNLTSNYKMRTDVFPKRIDFNSQFALEEIFQCFRDGIIKFPYKDYEKIAWLVEMCASMDTKISYDKHGGIKERFVKGNIPNDGLMALLYAYIAYKSKITDNFSNMDPRLKKDISKIAAAPVLGFSLPRMK